MEELKLFDGTDKTAIEQEYREWRSKREHIQIIDHHLAIDQSRFAIAVIFKRI